MRSHPSQFGRQTLAAVATLGIAVGVTTAAHALLLGMAYDFPHTDAWRSVVKVVKASRVHPSARAPISGAEFELIRQQTKALSDLAAAQGSEAANAEAAGRVLRVQVQPVTAAFFEAWGVQPALGRGFDAARQRDDEPCVVLSASAWDLLFDGDPAAPGRVLTLNGGAFTVIGVMPPSFWWPERRATVWTLMTTPTYDRAGAASVFGRLTSGHTTADATAELRTIAARAFPSHSEQEPWTIRAASLDEAARERLGTAAPALVGPPLAVVLLAAANISLLLWARAVARERELATRSALGASPSRLLGQLVAEALPLSLATVVVGGAAFALAARTLPQLIGVDSDRLVVSPTVLFTGVAIATLAPFAAALLPAVYAARLDLVRALNRLGPRRVVRRGDIQLHEVVVGVEVCLGVVLVITTLMFARLFARLGDVVPGFDPEPLLAVSAPLDGGGGVRGGAERLLGAADLLREVQSVPGVAAAALADHLPSNIGRREGTMRIALPGWTPEQERTLHVNVLGEVTPPFVMVTHVGPEYLETVGLALRAGRWLSAGDGDGADVAVISASAAERYWPGRSPVGQQFRLGAGPEASWLVVVGVVRDVMTTAGRQVMPSFRAYLPLTPATIGDRVFVVARSTTPADLAAQRVVHALWTADRARPVEAVTLRRHIDGLWDEQGTLVRFFELFAGLALAIAIVGVSGVATHAVARRTREIGIRMSVGAPPHRVVAATVRRGVAVLLVGGGIGAVGTVVVTWFSWRELLSITSRDPHIWASLVLIVLGAGVVAFFVPARRAVSVDPSTALRAEG